MHRELNIPKETELAEQLSDQKNVDLRFRFESLMHHMGDDRAKCVRQLLAAYEAIPREHRKFDTLSSSGSGASPKSNPTETNLFGAHKMLKTEFPADNPQDWSAIFLGLAFSASTTSAGLWLRRRICAK